MNESNTDFQANRKINTGQQILKRWKSGQKYLNQFWKIWNKEYLLSLRERNQSVLKQSRKSVMQIPQVGDVVLIKENLPRGQWKVGRISKLIKGKDDVIRSAKVMLPSKGSLHRALKLLYPIECPDNEDKDNRDFKENENDTGSEVDESHVSHTISTCPSREAAVKAREKLSVYFDGDN